MGRRRVRIELDLAARCRLSLNEGALRKERSSSVEAVPCLVDGHDRSLGLPGHTQAHAVHIPLRRLTASDTARPQDGRAVPHCLTG
jgi:hypothetical protein